MTNKNSSSEIRQSFFDFFVSKGHKIVPSAPMVVKDDPTLMFTNAGMNQFKNVILGNDPIKYSRVADAQKCLRVSGKHNDLEEVGHDTYHHTMFEMLGNWSFGDYFKEEAIAWAWEYLTEVLKLDKDRIYVTVFEGAADENLERDNQAAEIWERYLSKNRIIDGNKKDNFWEMGDTGPCGPCSEIHYDNRTDEERLLQSGASLVNADHPQVIEIWNNVFMQFDRKTDGTLVALPNKVIDTGMGFERLCMIVQGKKSNYDTDVFQPIISKISEITGFEYGKNEQQDIAMRVIADHLRTIAFSVADGQLPSNAKAGYVIRRILRRAVRYGYTFLDKKEPFIYNVVDTLIELMGDAYSEIRSQKDLIKKVLKEEEESFLRTLETGIKLLEKNMPPAGETLSGKIAFTLYDTYGFPIDLTELILKENNIEIDMKEFDKQMTKQKERARSASAMETGDWILVNEGESHFVGYDKIETDTRVLRYRQVKQQKNTHYQIVLETTPFYAEMGGQIGDKGVLLFGQETVAVFDTKNENGLTIHLTNSLPDDPTAPLIARIDKSTRYDTARNHSATHLLHEALREVLGTHVEQKGSYVSDENLRFDFSHYQKMSTEEIRKVERIANQKIRENHHCQELRNIPISEAKAMGAVALFGEKYGEQVRVIRFGSSIELCGGTHVQATGDIGMVRILSESSIAAGVRRIEAITGKAVEQFIDLQQEEISTVRELLNNTPEPLKTLKALLTENQELKKQMEQQQKEKLHQLKDQLLKSSVQKEGVTIIKHQDNLPVEAVKYLAFQLKNTLKENCFIAIGSVYHDKPSITVLISQDLVEKGYNAVNIVRKAAKEIQGGGGGQPFFATAGGKNQAGITTALEKIDLHK